MGDSAVLLRVNGVEATYQNAIVTLHNMDLTVQHGEVRALLGTNGMDKSSMLKTISNLLMPKRGQVIAGTIVFDGHDVVRTTSTQLVRPGLVQVLEGRCYSPSLSIKLNLVTDALGRSASRAETAADLERVHVISPHLKAWRRVAAGLTSGGERQMAVIGRALMSRPRLLMLDEPSVGLAPLVVRNISARLRQLNREDRLSILVAEQNSTVTLQYADHTTMLEAGATMPDDTAEALGQREDAQHFYFGYDVAHQAPALARAVHSSFPIVHNNRNDNLS